MFKLIGLFLTLSYLHADLVDHLKQAPNKSDGHKIRNIDFIYMINLDQRPEKFRRCVDQLSLYGIDPYRFSAVNGWKLSLEQINDVGIQYAAEMESGKGTRYLKDGTGEPYHEITHIPGVTYFSHCMSRGAIGIVLSHLSILQDADESGYETIWVMEDDIEVVQNPHLLSDLIDKLDTLDEAWDILFTDRDTKNNRGEYVPCTAGAWRPNFSPLEPEKFLERYELCSGLRYVGARYGAYSMIIRKSGIKKLLQFFKHYHVFLPFDMDYTLPPGIRFYTVTSDVVSTQINAPSDNGAPNYESY